MRPRKLTQGLALAVVFAVGLVVAAPNAHAAAKEWRIQTALSSGSMYFQLIQSFAARVDAMSGGRLKTTVLPNGAVASFGGILDVVDKGVVEAGVGWPQLWSGKEPAAYLFSNQPSIGGLDQLGLLSWFYEGDGYDLYKELYDKQLEVEVQPFIIQVSGGQPLGWFSRPIEGITDFKEFKYRSPPGITGELFKEMGVAAVAMPGDELVPAAQKGTIDAAEWINPGEDIKLGLHQVWKHYYLQGFHQATDLAEIIINKDFWNSLDPSLQAIIEDAAKASVMESIAANIFRNAEALKVLQEEHGVKLYETPESLYTAFQDASKAVVARYSAEDEFFKRVADNQRAFANTAMPYWMELLELYQKLYAAADK